MKLNWTKIRNEYINSDTSYSKLAKKHKVSLQAIKDRGTREKWVAQKKEQQTRIQQITNQKTAEKIAEKDSDLTVRVLETTAELLDMVKEAMLQSKKCVVKEKRKYTRAVKDPETGKTVYVDIEEEKPKVAETTYISKRDLRDIAVVLEKINTIQTMSKEGTVDSGNTITFIEDLPDE